MAMGKRRRHAKQASMWVATQDLPRSAAHPFEAVRPASDGLEEVVGDKGYHNNQSLVDLEAVGVRSYISEPDRGRRKLFSGWCSRRSPSSRCLTEGWCNRALRSGTYATNHAVRTLGGRGCSRRDD